MIGPRSGGPITMRPGSRVLGQGAVVTARTTRCNAKQKIEYQTQQMKPEHQCHKPRPSTLQPLEPTPAPLYVEMNWKHADTAPIPVSALNKSS